MSDYERALAEQQQAERHLVEVRRAVETGDMPAHNLTNALEWVARTKADVTRTQPAALSESNVLDAARSAANQYTPVTVQEERRWAFARYLVQHGKLNELVTA